MFPRRKRQYSPPSPAPTRVRIQVQGLEQLVSSIAELTTAVNNLVAVEQQVLDALTAPPTTGTVLTQADQTALDAAVSTVQSVADTLSGALPKPAATEPPAAVEPATTPAADASGTETPAQ